MTKPTKKAVRRVVKIKTLYLIDPSIKWATFKILQDKLVKDDGPTPVGMDKMLWQMNRDKLIHLYFCEEMAGNMGVTVKLPPYKELKVINSLPPLTKKR